MAIFVAKPSRGTLVFFGLVVASLAAVRGYARHEVRVERRDGPASEEALRFAVCLAGGHAGWIFRDPEGPDAQARWAYTLTEWLKVTATAPELATLSLDRSTAWPLRCRAPLEGLSERLLRVGGAGVTASHASRLGSLLRTASQSPQHLLAAVDDGSLGNLTAQVLAETYTLSTGTRSRWIMPSTGPEVPTGPVTPRWRPVAPTVQRVVPVAADAVLSRGYLDGITRRLRFVDGRLEEERVGAVVPWDEEARGALGRASSEVSPVALALGPSVRVLPWPEDFTAAGLPRDARWHGAWSSDRFALLAEDFGTLSVWATPDDGPGWTPARVVGPPESHLAALLGPDTSPSDTSPAGWRLTGLRPVLDEAAVVQYRLRPVGRSLASETVRVRRVPDDAAPIALRGARFVTCSDGPTQYLAAVGQQAVTVLRARGDDLVEIATRPVQWPRHRAARLQCDATRALLSPDGTEPIARPWAWQLFQFAEGLPNAAQLPMPVGLASNTEVYAVGLTTEGAVAVVGTPEALRVMRLGSDGTTWTPGSLLMTLRPALQQRRAVQQVTLLTEGDRVLAFVRGDTQTALPLTLAEREAVPRPPPRYSPPAPFTLIAWSRDGGQRFVSF